ncbi:hypothetical protein ACHFCA_12775 [Delftia tsuruhatensis]
MASTAWRTRSRVFSETMEGLPRAREAVISETPAASATSCSVAGLGGVGVFMGKRDRGRVSGTGLKIADRPPRTGARPALHRRNRD